MGGNLCDSCRRVHFFFFLTAIHYSTGACDWSLFLHFTRETAEFDETYE